jgi:transcription elongation factor GreB
MAFGRNSRGRVRSTTARGGRGAEKGAAGAGEKTEGGEAATRPVEKNYITPAGYKKLTEEFDFLRAKKRPEVVSALADAAAEGDRSENAEYIYRKRQLRDIDRRLRFLSKRLDHVAVVDPGEQKRRDRVFFGATVKVEDEEGETCVYRIVGVDEINGTAGDISWKSPVGRALLGKALHDTTSVKWHAGTRELTIVEIDYVGGG